jgi:hypothetical protein
MRVSVILYANGWFPGNSFYFQLYESLRTARASLNNVYLCAVIRTGWNCILYVFESQLLHGEPRRCHARLSMTYLEEFTIRQLPGNVIDMSG